MAAAVRIAGHEDLKAQAIGCCEATWDLLGGPTDKLALAVNASRDFTWTYLSIGNYSAALTATTNPTAQMNGQFLYSTIAMIPALLLGMYFTKPEASIEGEDARKRSLIATRAEMVARTVAASVAVYTWDLGQMLGIDIGTAALNMSTANAGFFASIFTGMFEGATQTAIIAFAQKLCERYQAGKDICSAEALKEATLNACKALPLGLTIGAIPGAVWQLIYNACAVAGTVNPITVSVFVSLAVFAANIGAANLIARMQPAFERTLSSCISGATAPHLPAAGSDLEAAVALLASEKTVMPIDTPGGCLGAFYRLLGTKGDTAKVKAIEFSGVAPIINN